MLTQSVGTKGQNRNDGNLAPNPLFARHLQLPHRSSFRGRQQEELDFPLRLCYYRIQERATKMTKPSAETLVQALISTRDRHLQGFMSKPTYKAHMLALWRNLEYWRLREEAEALIQELGLEANRLECPRRHNAA